MKVVNTLIRLAMLLVIFSSPTLVFAAAYYVKPNGNDDADGRTHATAWRTLDKVSRTKFLAGDDVYLFSGSVFSNQRLDIRWSGKIDNPAVIGCYYLVDGTTKVCGGEQPKPEIKGTLSPECRAQKNCAYDSPSAMPTGYYTGLINIYGDYVTIQDLRLINSAGRGITGSGGNSIDGDNLMTGVVIQRNVVRDTGNAGVLLENGVQYAEIRGNQITNSSWCWRNGRTDHCPSWPGALSLVSSKPSYSIIEDNVVHSGAGEGINTSRSSYVVIRGNLVGNFFSSTIYGNHSAHNLIENNIVWGNPDNKNAFYRGGVSYSGIEFGLEENFVDSKYGGGGFHVVRNNIVLGSAFCIGQNSITQKAISAGQFQGAAVYGNTCIGQADASVLLNGKSPAGARNWVFANNLFFSPNAQKKYGNCQLPGGLSDIVFKNNLWDDIPSNAACQGPGDVYDQDPRMRIGEATARNVDWTSVPDWRKFLVSANSAAVGGGIAIQGITKELLSSNWKGMAGRFGKLSHSKCDGTYYESALSVDFHCFARREGQTNIGALQSYDFPEPPVLWVSSGE